MHNSPTLTSKFAQSQPSLLFSIMVLVFVIMFSMLMCSLLLQVFPGSTETRLCPDGFGTTLSRIPFPSLRGSYNCAATTSKPENPTPRPGHVEKGARLNKVYPHNLPPLTDMTGWCEVRSANKEGDKKRSVQRP